MNKRWMLVGAAALLALVVAWWLWPRSETAPAPGAGGGRPAAQEVRRTPTAAGGIDGVVVDDQGAPVAGAVVRATRGRGAEEALAATSGADGRFALDAAPGRWWRTASAPGRVPAEAEADVAAGARASVELRLAPGGVTVRGTVTDATGGPVDGALVVLAPEQGVLAADARRAAAALTGADGRFELGLVPGRWRVTTTHPEYVRDERAVDVGPGGATVDVELVPGGVVEGTVRDRATGAPVPGARVRYAREVVGQGGPMRGRFAEERERGVVDAGADGAFRIAGLGAGRILLSAETDERASDAPTEVQLAIAETATGVDVWVAPALSIAGVVTYDDGTPAAGADVMVGMRGELRGVAADADGRFRVGGVRAGRHLVSASADDALPGEPVNVEVDAASVTDVKVTLRRGAFVTGRVDPAAIAEVRVVEAESPDLLRPGLRLRAIGGVAARTAADGTFRLGPLEPGPATLRARATDGRRGEATVNVEPGGTAGVVIALEARGRIAGRVVTKAGAPLPGAVVSLRRRGAGAGLTIVNGVDIGAERAPVDHEGRFEVAGLDAGTWELTALDETGAPLAFDRAERDEPVTVVLAANQSKDGVDLVVEAKDGVIRGVVVGPDGAPVPDAWVTASAITPPLHELPRRAGADDGDEAVMVAVLEDGGRRAGEIAPVLTGPDGRFEIRHLRRGAYRVSAEGLRGGARGALDRVETGADVTVKLQLLSRLRGTVTLGGAPVTDFLVVAQGPTEKRRDVHAADGAFTLLGLDPGVYTVEARSARGTGRATATVEAGQESTVAIAIEAPGTITGRLVDASGAPLAGRMVIATPRQKDGELRIELDGPPPTTDADGRFRIDAEPGPRTVVVLGQGRPDAMKDVDVLAGKTVDVGTLTAGT